MTGKNSDTEKNFNIIFIVIDALRAGNLGCYGYGGQTSPFIDGLASKGIFFDRCFSTVTKTDPSLTTIFSGKFPASHGIRNQGFKVSRGELSLFDKAGNKLLPELLREYGYRTMAVDWLGRWHKKGYDVYSGPLDDSSNLKRRRLWDFSLCSHLGIGKIINAFYTFFKYKRRSASIRDNAGKITNRAIKLIEDNRDKNFFLFLHYWDTHVPYYAPEKIIKKNPGPRDETKIEEIARELNGVERDRFYWKVGNSRYVGDVLNRYDASIRYVDSEIGRLVRFLEVTGLDKDTIIFLTADHGESLTEHGIYFEHEQLYDVTLHVPLIIIHPGIGGVRVNGFVQHVDIFPTILDFLGIGCDGLGIEGLSLLPLIEGRLTSLRDFVYAEEFPAQRFAVRSGDHKYILSLRGAGEELYNLSEDPGELRNLATVNKETAKKYKELLNDFFSLD